VHGKDKRHLLTGGLVLIALGVLIILDKTGIYIFSHSWPILLIVISLGVLLQRVKDLGGWIIGAAGVVFLITENWGYRLFEIAKYLLPILLIVIGADLIRRRARKS